MVLLKLARELLFWKIIWGCQHRNHECSFREKSTNSLAPPTLLTCLYFKIGFISSWSQFDVISCWETETHRAALLLSGLSCNDQKLHWGLINLYQPVFTNPFKSRWIAHKIFCAGAENEAVCSVCPFCDRWRPAGRESASLWESHQLFTKHTVSSHSPLQVVPHRIIWTVKLGSLCVVCIWGSWQPVVVLFIDRRDDGRKMSRCSVDNWSK